MKRIFPRISALLLTLLLLLALPFGALAADKLTPVEALALQLQEAQSDVTLAAQALADARKTLADLQKKYDKNPGNTKLEDQLLDAMILEKEAAIALSDAQLLLLLAQEDQASLAEEAECEDLIVEYDGKYADIVLTVSVDENMVIYGLTAEVDGSERDQLVGGNDYLYQFIGKDIPLTIGNGKKDDVAPLKDAQQTSKDLVAALNSLVHQEAEPQPEKKAEKQTGPIIEPQAIADYIFDHGRLPDNFITKKEAQKLGWDSRYNYVGDVAPGKSIGGDRFGNYEGRLPDKKGRVWYEADCYYQGKKRNAHRILFSNDGLVFYTDDHYETFTEMKRSKQ